MRAMKAAVISITMLCALRATHVQAKCRWVADPVLRYHSNIVEFNGAAFCDSGEEGELKASFVFDGKAVDTSTKRWSKHITGPGRVRVTPGSYTFKLFSSRACPKDYRPGKREKFTTEGYGYKDYVVAERSMLLKLRGEGALKSLNRDMRGVFQCRVCFGFKGSSSKNSARVREGRFVARVGRQWFECARRASTISVRLFAGPDKQAVTNAYRPRIVIKNVLKKFRLKEGSYITDIGLPVSRLCAQAQYWGWELQGRGELKSMSGGGRRVMRCK